MTFTHRVNIALDTEFKPIRDQYETCDVAHMTSEQILALRVPAAGDPVTPRPKHHDFKKKGTE